MRLTQLQPPVQGHETVHSFPGILLHLVCSFQVLHIEYLPFLNIPFTIDSVEMLPDGGGDSMETINHEKMIRDGPNTYTAVGQVKATQSISSTSLETLILQSYYSFNMDSLEENN